MKKQSVKYHTLFTESVLDDYQLLKDWPYALSCVNS